VNVLVYRPDELAVDRHGDPLDSSGQVVRQTSPGDYLGTLAGVVLADPEVQSLSRGVDTDTSAGGAQSRGAVADVQALIGAPVGAPIELRHNDLIVTADQGVTYALWGPVTYQRANVITGQPVKVNGVSYYWLRATAVVN
jgi:hypothetical protein